MIFGFSKKKEGEAKGNRQEFVSFQVKWIEEKEEFVLKVKELKKGLWKACPVRKEASVFWKIYLYMVAEEKKEVLVVHGGRVYVGKVDVLGNEVIFLSFPEGEEEEYGDRILELLGSGLPDEEVFFKEVSRAAFSFQLKTNGKKIVFLVVFVVMFSVGGYFGASYFLGKKEKVKITKKVKKKKENLNIFKAEEKDPARFLIVRDCMRKLKERFSEYSRDDGFVVKSVEGIFSERNDGFSCSFRVEREFLYPAENTVRRGKRKWFGMDVVGCELKRAEFLRRKSDWENWERDADYNRCVLVLLKSGFEVERRGGGQVVFRVNREFRNGYRAVRFLDFLSEVEKVCGGRFQVDRINISSEEKGGVRFRGQFVLLWDRR